MALPLRHTSAHRRRIWNRACFEAAECGRGDGFTPICNICDQPVTREQVERDGWHESHHPLHPRAFGGTTVGVAHSACNLEHGRTVVVPAVAKSNRIIKRQQRRTFAGSGRFPMRGGVDSRETKTMRGGVKRRMSLAEKHAAFLAKRAILTQRAEG
jgi:hypothetical protein